MTTSDLVTNAVVEKPDEWPVRTAASFNPFITSGSRGWAKYYADHGDLFMRITNLKRHKIKPDLSDLQHVALPPSEKEGLRTGLRNGDILISITADIGIIGYVDESVPTPAYINQHVACLRLPEDQVSPKFVAYYLASAEPQRRFSENTDVGAKTGINLTTVGRLTFPCPPLAEQQAIAEALSDADALIQGLERLIAKKRLIKQGAMQDLLTAKRRLPGFSGEWSNFRLSEHGKFLSGSGFPLIYQGRTSGDYPFFKVSDFSGEANGVVLTIANHYINADTQKKLGARIFPAGAIAFAKIGAAIFLERKRMIAQNSCLDNNMAAFVLQDASLCADLLLARFQSFTLGDLVSSTALPAIASSDLKAIEFYLPKDLEEQKTIARVLADMDAEIQAIESRLEKARLVKEGMMQNLLTGRIRLV